MSKSSLLRILTIFTLLIGVLALAWPGATVQAVEPQQTATLEVSVDQTAKSGLPGSSVLFNFSVKNNSAVDVNVTISATPSGLGNVSAPGSVFIPAGGTQPVPVAVNLSVSALPGSSEGITVTFTPADPTIPAVSKLVSVSVSAPPTAQPTIPPGAARPLVVVSGYYLDKDTIAVGDSFKLFVELRNNGSLNASNLILSFVNESFLPQDTGGVVALGSLDVGSKREVSQRFLVSSALAGQGVGIVPVKLTYTDANGTAYNEAFSITLQLRVYSGAAAPTPTPTPAQIFRPQLVIASYQTDVDPLQPGTQFNLDLEVGNLGNADARSVTMVLGGGVTPDASGTPQPGGVSGGSGDLTNFAPVGSSNLVYLGDLPASATVKTSTRLIVNVSANPGAYTLKISFVYTDPKGNRLVDDQVITLLIYQLPSVEVNFYRDPGPIYAGQMATLPLQVVNLGRKQAVLGNMTVTAAGAEVQNNTTLVGPLDPGGFFTLDAMLIPPQPGSLELNVAINYTDDFNQARQINQTITLNVLEGAPVGPEGPGMNGTPGPSMPDVTPVVEETFWQKVLRFLKGLIGLDSAPPQPETFPGGMEGTPVEGPVNAPVEQPVIIPPQKGP
ncbi:MAG TPA: hypothetical protein DEQ80_01635 [Anaerolinea thermolimosa]|uniref:CARDB domain-containing protein n=1 Tax=Anaerolinea thermolimosa TaxID=229919 RepID=A0A3D1JFK0_9CHLR|nr:CARDB domain-containing protein [Anaerolinea thermolimosa]GAP08179.1 hypothetical protein ATHL_03080 [Anaerolinea thermolimosa]HCE16538.1 hypothetical protein [Anaerolinea thermolimosa]